jgi:hypothetical protein
MGCEVQVNSPESPDTADIHPLARAHAHNDYHHERPLLDALSHGFCSVEADVFLVDGALLVGHTRSELSADRTLESLYLDPLFERVQKNDGRIFPGGSEFTLLVDVKTDGEATYLVLDEILAAYSEMLTSVMDGRVQEKAVTVVISGNRAWGVIEADSTRYAGVDGRLSDLSSDRPEHLMPLISDHWGRVSKWSGVGPMPDGERAKLRQILHDAHAAGRRVRFWATADKPSPERTAVWAELLSAGVDSIGTDDLAGLKTFLLNADSGNATGSIR